LGLDPAQSWLVGDSERDIRCGEAAGVARRILVRTGNGRGHEPRLTGGREAGGELLQHVAGDLAGAADWILAGAAR
jgi:phosphoglycolate phosphatase-like HAD superfamily hydrolase